MILRWTYSRILTIESRKDYTQGTTGNQIINFIGKNLDRLVLPGLNSLLLPQSTRIDSIACPRTTNAGRTRLVVNIIRLLVDY